MVEGLCHPPSEIVESRETRNRRSDKNEEYVLEEERWGDGAGQTVQ